MGSHHTLSYHCEHFQPRFSVVSPNLSCLMIYLILKVFWRTLFGQVHQPFISTNNNNGIHNGCDIWITFEIFQHSSRMSEVILFDASELTAPWLSERIAILLSISLLPTSWLTTYDFRSNGTRSVRNLDDQTMSLA